MATEDLKIIQKDHPEYVRRVGKHFKRNFILLALDTAFFTFSTALVSHDTILPAFLNNLTDNPVLIGLIPAIFNLGYFLPQIISAYITQTTPKRKKMIFWIALAERLGILLIAVAAQSSDLLSPNLVIFLLFFAFTLYSSTLGLIIPAYSDFTSKAVYKKRGLFYGINQAIGGVIGFSASLAAAKLLDMYAFPINFRWIFWLSFIFSFISPILIANFVETEYPVQPEKKNIEVFSKHVWKIIKENSNLRKYVYTRQLVGLAAMGYSFFSIYALQKFNLPASMLGIYTMIILLSQSLSGIIWGTIGDKHGYKWLLIFSSLIMFAQGLIALTANRPFGFLLIASMIGFIYSAMYILHPNLIFEIAPPEETSLYIGLSNTMIAPVIALGPILGGKIVESLGYTQLFIAVCIAAFFAFLLATFVFVEPRKNQ